MDQLGAAIVELSSDGILTNLSGCRQLADDALHGGREVRDVTLGELA